MRGAGGKAVMRNDEGKDENHFASAALGIDGLWDEIREKIAGLDEKKDRGFAKIGQSWSDELRLEHADGRAVLVRRVRDRIVVEAAGRDGYEKKLQGRLRRSFVEPRPDLIAKEIARQVKLLLDAYTPLWASSEEQKTKAAGERKVRHERTVELAQVLAGTTFLRAVTGPDPEEDNSYEAAKTRAILEGSDDRKPAKVSFQVREDGTHIEFEGPVSPAVAASVAEVLVPYLAPRIDCGRKGCKERNLTNHEERRQERCHQHRKWESA